MQYFLSGLATYILQISNAEAYEIVSLIRVCSSIIHMSIRLLIYNS